MGLKKDYLLHFLEGYKKADEFIASEKRKKLSRMTFEDSLRQYDHLCSLYAILEDKRLARLENRIISFLIKRRLAFDNAGGIRR
jgi:hypothetical protein